MSTTAVTVPIPEQRITEFYAMFAVWLSQAPGVGSPPAAGIATSHSWSDGDEEVAAELWRTFTSIARAVFSVLIDNPGKQYGSEALAERAELESAYTLAGALSWPIKRCAAAGKESLIHSYALTTGGSNYWMEETTARVFAAARDSV